MYSLKINVYLAAALLIVSCNQHESGKRTAGKSLLESPVKTMEVVIAIQPFEDLAPTSIAYVERELKKVITKVIVNRPIGFPSSTLNHAKSRHRADSLIKFLANQTKNGNVTIGLTSSDISTTKGEYPDWGVMGLGYRPGKSCMVSSYRLKGANKQEKFFKVAIHELGHTQGLPHCPVKSCFMRDAEGKDHLNEEVAFCPKCRAVLIKAGWALK